MIPRTLLFRNSRGSRGCLWLLGRPLAESVDVCCAGGQSFDAFIRGSTRSYLRTGFRFFKRIVSRFLALRVGI